MKPTCFPSRLDGVLLKGAGLASDSAASTTLAAAGPTADDEEPRRSIRGVADWDRFTGGRRGRPVRRAEAVTCGCSLSTVTDTLEGCVSTMVEPTPEDERDGDCVEPSIDPDDPRDICVGSNMLMPGVTMDNISNSSPDTGWGGVRAGRGTQVGRVCGSQESAHMCVQKHSDNITRACCGTTPVVRQTNGAVGQNAFNIRARAGCGICLIRLVRLVRLIGLGGLFFCGHELHLGTEIVLIRGGHLHHTPRQHVMRTNHLDVASPPHPTSTWPPHHTPPHHTPSRTTSHASLKVNVCTLAVVESVIVPPRAAASLRQIGRPNSCRPYVMVTTGDEVRAASVWVTVKVNTTSPSAARACCKLTEMTPERT